MGSIKNGNGSSKITNLMLFREIQEVKSLIQPIPDLVEGKKDHEIRIRGLEKRVWQAATGLVILLFIADYIRPLIIRAFGG